MGSSDLGRRDTGVGRTGMTGGGGGSRVRSRNEYVDTPSAADYAKCDLTSSC